MHALQVSDLDFQILPRDIQGPMTVSCAKTPPDPGKCRQ